MHKYIIGILWIVFGVLIFSTLLVSMHDSRPIVLALGYPISLIFMLAGFVHLASIARYTWLCQLCGAICLLIFPLGTALGVYYFWSYFMFRKTAV